VWLDPHLTLEPAVTARHHLSRPEPERQNFDIGRTLAYQFVRTDQWRFEQVRLGPSG
jgi:hypothetical protein